MSLFHLSEVPHITFFGNKLISSDSLTDHEVFACFMQVALCCFLCPSSNDRLDTKYIHQLGDPERARRFDVCQLVYKHAINGIAKMIKFTKAKGRKPKFFEFCSYALAVYYLDSLDFGVHVAGTGFPRAVSWQGDMIQVYSELDWKSKRCFCRRRTRKDLASCYLNEVNSNKLSGANCELLSAHHKEIMHDKFGNTLSGKTIDGIFDIVKRSNSSPLDSSNNAKMLVHSVLQFLVESRPWFKSSNKIGSASIDAATIAKMSYPHYADTPVGLANNPVDKYCSIRAPEMQPVAKVKSRLSLHLPENSSTSLCQDDLISPIGRMNLSPFPDCKDSSKAVVPSILDNLFANTNKGTRQAPIHVGDITPKSILVEKSPEVTITGTSSLKDRQNKIVENVDEVYNRTVHANSSHVIPSTHKDFVSKQTTAYAAQVVDIDNLPEDAHNTGKRSTFIVLQPKNPLIFPLAENKRFPVSDDDIMYYCAIVELAYTEQIQKNYALEYHGVHYSYVSLGQTLMRDGHIDNFLIPCFCRKLFEDNHPTKSGRHYFFSYIGESILDLSDPMHEKLARTSFMGAASASKGKRLDNSDRWKLFIFLDSFYSTKSDYQLAVQGPLMRNFVILWKKIFVGDEIDFKVFRLMTPAMPRQGNA